MNESGSFSRLSDRCDLHGLVSERSNRERWAALVSQSLFVIWPFTVTVFGVLVLLALLAHWYDRLAVALTPRRAGFQQTPAAAATPDAGNDSQARIQAAQAGDRRYEKWSQ
jgi:hypothetical protein